MYKGKIVIWQEKGQWEMEIQERIEADHSRNLLLKFLKNIIINHLYDIHVMFLGNRLC